ncbi:MAG: phenylalanine--tRNA ligase subunit alpha [Chlamydiota bacterium]
MHDEIKKLKDSFERDIAHVERSAALEELKVKYLGRKSPIQALMRRLQSCSPEERPAFGKLVNDLKKDVAAKIETQLKVVTARELDQRLEAEKIDITLPGRRRFIGRKHPLTQMLDRMLDVLVEMGFSIQYSSEVEGEYYNYGGLNYPPDHPARDMQDTFYIDEKTVLRSHTTTIQQHMMEKTAPPIRVAAPGKCYRNETITARSHVFFHQVDAVYIDKKVTFADLLATKEAFYTKVFGRPVEIRVRPSYFPFVEPGMEVDIKCTMCSGSGCPLCKHTGYLEVCGAGMVHPNVLRAGGLDPDTYTGYAWGGGVERLFMLQHGVEDIRLFTENDLRFLNQFPG